MNPLLIHLDASPLLSIAENASSKVGKISSIISWKNSVEMPSHPSALSFDIATIASLTSFRLDPCQPDFLLEVSDSGSLHLLLFPRDSAIALENSSCGCLQPGRPLRVLAGRGLGASPGVEEGCPAHFHFQEGYVEVGGSRRRGGGVPPDG
ncbi:unnamed protein product [Sphagnum balticum]